MSENEENMTEVSKKITDLVAELEHCRKRALEIELQLSIVDEALKNVREPRPASKKRGRPRKVPSLSVMSDEDGADLEEIAGPLVA